MITPTGSSAIQHPMLRAPVPEAVSRSAFMKSGRPIAVSEAANLPFAMRARCPSACNAADPERVTDSTHDAAGATINSEISHGDGVDVDVDSDVLHDRSAAKGEPTARRNWHGVTRSYPKR